MKGKNLLILTVLTMVVTHFSFAQTGWDEMEKNNHAEAKKLFEKALDDNPKSVEDIVGLIVLAEMERDYRAFNDLVPELIEASDDPYLYRLFSHTYAEDPNEIAKKEWSESFKIVAREEIADSLFEHRKYDDSKEAFNRFVGKYKWHITGPFENIQGSGFEVAYGPETESFNAEAQFDIDLDLDLEWHPIQNSPRDGIINFGDVLPSRSQGSVYYANTFVQLPKDQDITLSISRNSPIKIWVDDALVYSNNDKRNFLWDFEKVNLSLKAGTHRILIKMASLPGSVGSSFLAFNDGSSGGGYSFNLFGSGSLFDYFGGFDDRFTLRITDEKGNLFADINSPESTDYTKANHKATENANFLIDHFSKKLKADENNLANHYLAVKSHFREGYKTDGEALYVNYYRSKKQIALCKYLMAKLYAANGKGESADEIMNDVDESTPIFDLYDKKLDEIDPEVDEEKYRTSIEKMLALFPSNRSLMYDYIDFLADRGYSDEKKDFVKASIEKYPDYEEYLSPYLEDESYKPNEYTPQTDKEKAQDAKDAQKNLKKRISLSDYYTLIEHLKDKEKSDKVIELYDEVIAAYPHTPDYLYDKAEYLYAIEKYDAATASLNKALERAPYDADLYELLGDIQYDLKNEDKALEHYQTGKLYDQFSSYASGSFEDKIVKIKGQDNTKDRFDTKTFEDIMGEKDKWKDAYPDDEAVVLLYTKDAILNEDRTVDVYQRGMIYIQTEAGANEYTEANFSYFGNLSSVKVIKENGAEVTPDESRGYVVFKNLKPGDVIQVEGNFTWDLRNEIDREFYMMNYLSSGSPTYYAKLEVAIPKEESLVYKTYKVDDVLEKTEKDGFDFYRWEFPDLAKVEYEDAIVDQADMFGAIMVSTMTDWSAVADWYGKMTYRKFEPTYVIDEILDTVVNDDMTDEQKIVALYNFVTDEINYSYVSFLNSNFVPKNTGNTCSAKIGDCKDVSTLMNTLLLESGIDAFYVLVKTNHMPAQELLPSLHFDHVITGYELNGKTYYMDLTSDFYPHYALNEGDTDAFALKIKDGENKIFRLPHDLLDKEKNLVKVNVEATMQSDRSIDLNVSTVNPGLSGGFWREYLNGSSEEEEKQFILESLGYGTFEDLNLTDYDLGNLKEITEPLESSFDFKANNFSDNIGSMLIFQVPFMKTALASPALSVEKRHNRLYVGSLMELDPIHEEVSISFPSGFRLMEVPDDVKLESDFVDYSLTFKKEGNGLKVVRQTHVKQDVIDIEDFEAFKKIYLKMVDEDTKKLSLVKG